jgi:hypothetical protein
MVGTSKSTIAHTVAETFHDRKRLKASFFYSQGRTLRAESTTLIITLTLQLTEFFPDITPYIHNTITHDICEQPLTKQWNALVLQPLSVLEENLLTPLVLVFVIDALDECEGNEYINKILRLLSTAKDLKTIQLRIFVTSRSESYIQNITRSPVAI